MSDNDECRHWTVWLRPSELAEDLHRLGLISSPSLFRGGKVAQVDHAAFVLQPRSKPTAGVPDNTLDLGRAIPPNRLVGEVQRARAEPNVAATVVQRVHVRVV